MRNVKVWKHKEKDVYFQVDYHLRTLNKLPALSTESLEKIFQCNWVRDVNQATPVCQIPDYWLKHPVAKNFIAIDV